MLGEYHPTCASQAEASSSPTVTSGSAVTARSCDASSNPRGIRRAPTSRNLPQRMFTPGVVGILSAGCIPSRSRIVRDDSPFACSQGERVTRLADAVGTAEVQRSPSSRRAGTHPTSYWQGESGQRISDSRVSWISRCLEVETSREPLWTRDDTSWTDDQCALCFLSPGHPLRAADL